METDIYLQVLTAIARRFNAARIVWAVGGSMLLYFKGIIKAFHDIDILVKTEDSETAKAILAELGTLKSSKPSAMFKSKAFYELTIDGVDVDVIAGFTIVKDGIAHDCALQEDEIEDTIQIGGETIPLHSLAVWRRNYRLMNQTEKVRMLDAALHTGSIENSR